MAERSKPKVYINPNYKSSQGSNMVPLHQHNTIHINQNFSKGNLQHSNANKIFINPNFIQAKMDKIVMPFVNEQTLLSNDIKYNMQVPIDTHLLNVNQNNSISQYQTVSNSSKSRPINNAVTRDKDTSIKSRYSFIRTTETTNISSHKHLDKSQKTVKENTPLQSPLVKSRYQLIRKNENKMSTYKSQEKSRLKISKYKVISVNNTQSNNIHIKNDIRTKCISNVYASPYKTLRNNITSRSHLNNSIIKSVISVKPLVLTNKYKIEVKNKILQPHIKRKSYQTTIENIKGKSNINNIPCPLFSKYGKCLRKINGKCEYLHDKKHVALCRKFLKGICHDENCSLSHELSMKKMPTCYFYLKGMCFKDNCPYLHVKLNEKTKICQDFLRGYCEKGGDCSFRHVKAEVKRKLRALIHSPTTTKNLLVKNGRSKKTCQTKLHILNMHDESALNIKAASVPETRYYKKRYYKKIENEQPNCDLIKPTRCKLGTLPSFIQL